MTFSGFMQRKQLTEPTPSEAIVSLDLFIKGQKSQWEGYTENQIARLERIVGFAEVLKRYIGESPDRLPLSPEEIKNLRIRNGINSGNARDDAAFIELTTGYRYTTYGQRTGHSRERYI